MRTAATFAIMCNEDTNIFSNCSDEVYKEGEWGRCGTHGSHSPPVLGAVRQTTIQCVLATDFGKHFEILGHFKG